jgi:hypothetical protein
MASILVQAQSFEGGVMAGMTTSQVDGDNLSGYELPGFHLGFYTYTALNERSELQLELSFIQKGSRQEQTDSSIFYRMRLNYIAIPIIYRYRWKNLGFEIGPALDILVNAQEEDISGPLPEAPFNRFVLTGVAGVNYHFSDRFWVSFRSVNAITRIRPGPANRPGLGPLLGGDGQRSLSLSFGLHYSFSKLGS